MPDPVTNFISVQGYTGTWELVDDPLKPFSQTTVETEARDNAADGEVDSVRGQRNPEVQGPAQNAVRAQADEWVDLLLDTYKTEDSQLASEKLAEDIGKDAPTAYKLNLDTPQGARDVMLEVCRNMREKVIDEGGIAEKMELCRRKLAEERNRPGADPEACRRLEEKFSVVEDAFKELVKARQELVKHIPSEKRELCNLNPGEGEKDQLAVYEMKSAAKAMQDFRYDYQRAHGKFGVFKSVTSWVKQELFSVTRNPVFRWVHNFFAKDDPGADKPMKRFDRLTVSDRTIPKSAFDAEAKLAAAFGERLNAFIGELGEPGIGRVDLAPADQSSKTEPNARAEFADDLIEDLRVVEDALFVKSGAPNFSYHVEEGLLEAIQPMAFEEGSRDFVLGVRGGVVVPIPVAELSVGAKVEYGFRVTGNGNGGVTIERLVIGGAQGRTGVSSGVFKVNATGEFLGGKGKSTEYSDPKSAVKSLAGGGLGFLRTFMVRGADISQFLKLGVNLGSIRTGENFSDAKFLTYVKKHNLFKTTDAILMKRNNKTFGGRREFSRIRGGIGGHAKAQFGGLVNTGAGIDFKYEQDLKAKRTDLKTFYVYFTTEHTGEAGKMYGLLSEYGEECIESHESMHRILESEPATVEEKQRLVNDVMEEMRAMIKREAAYVQRLVEEEGPAETDEAICENYRRASVALVALQDKLATVGDAISEETRKEIDTLRREVRDMVELPGVDMSDEVLQRELYVSREHDDGRIRLKGHFSVSLNVTHETGNRILQENENLASEVLNVGNELMRAGTDAFTQGLANGVGLNPSVAVDVVYEKPNGDDPRPFRNMPSVTLDIRPQDNLGGRTLLSLIQDAYLRAAKQPESGLAEDGLDLKTIATFLGIKSATSAGTRAYYDVSGALISGNSPDQTVANDSFLGDSIFDDFTWESQKLIRLRFDGGRLSFVGFGDATIFNIELNQKIGMVEVGGQVTQNTAQVRKSVWETPSFDALTAKCDDLRRLGNDIEWHKFSMTNKAAFLRMAEIVGGNRTDGDRHAGADRKLFESALARMRRDIEREPFQSKRELMMRNLSRLLEASSALAGYLRDKEGKSDEASDQLIVDQMRIVLEAVADHYNIVDGGGAAVGGKLAETLAKNYEFRDAGVDGGGLADNDWEIAEKKRKANPSYL